MDGWIQYVVAVAYSHSHCLSCNPHAAGQRPIVRAVWRLRCSVAARPTLSAGPSLRQPLCRIVSINIVFWRLMSLLVKPCQRELRSMLLILNSVFISHTLHACQASFKPAGKLCRCHFLCVLQESLSNIPAHLSC